ncbi:hypothetical protein ACFX14_003842 [Malus domestica]
MCPRCVWFNPLVNLEEDLILHLCFITRTVSKGPWNILHFWISLCSLASHSSSGEIKTGIRPYLRPAAFIIESDHCPSLDDYV